MKIPFDIKFRPQIDSGEYKVETEEGSPARIICWDSPINKERPIIAIVFDEQIEQYKADGHYDDDYETSNYDLFIITPEPELSEFEDRLRIICENAVKEANLSPWRTSEDFAKNNAAELLNIARKELEPEVLERLEIAYKNQDEVVYENGKREGKAEALKDLPRWIDDGLPEGSAAIDIGGLCGFDFIRRHGRLLRISDIEKLPGLKED